MSISTQGYIDFQAVLKRHNLTNVGDWSGRKAVDSSVILAYERSAALKEEFEVNFQGLHFLYSV